MIFWGDLTVNSIYKYHYNNSIWKIQYNVEGLYWYLWNFNCFVFKSKSRNINLS